MQVQNGATGKVLPRFPKNIARYYLLRILVGVNGFFLSAVPSLWAGAAMDNHDVALLEVWYSIATIPLLFLGGALADLKGRRAGMIFGLGSIAVGYVIYAELPFVTAMWCAELMIAIGWAFYLPADISILRDSLRAAGQSDSFEEVRSKGFALGLAAMALTTVAGGRIAVHSPRLCIAVSAASMFAAAIVSFMFEEPKRAEIEHGIGVGVRIAKLVRMVKTQIAIDAELQKLIGMSAVLGSCGLVTFLFLQSYCTAQGLSAAHFGVVLAANSLLAAFLAKGMPSIERKLGFNGLQVIAVACAFVPPIVAGAWGDSISVPLFVLQALGKAFTEVALSARINALAKDEDGASLNAFSQIGFRLMSILACLVAWFVPLPLGAAGIYLATAVVSVFVIMLGATTIRIFSRRGMLVQ